MMSSNPGVLNIVRPDGSASTFEHVRPLNASSLPTMKVGAALRALISNNSDVEQARSVILSALPHCLPHVIPPLIDAMVKAKGQASKARVSQIGRWLFTLQPIACVPILKELLGGKKVDKRRKLEVLRLVQSILDNLEGTCILRASSNNVDDGGGAHRESVEIRPPSAFEIEGFPHGDGYGDDGTHQQGVESTLRSMLRLNPRDDDDGGGGGDDGRSSSSSSPLIRELQSEGDETSSSSITGAETITSRAFPSLNPPRVAPTASEQRQLISLSRLCPSALAIIQSNGRLSTPPSSSCSIDDGDTITNAPPTRLTVAAADVIVCITRLLGLFSAWEEEQEHIVQRAKENEKRRREAAMRKREHAMSMVVEVHDDYDDDDDEGVKYAIPQLSTCGEVLWDSLDVMHTLIKVLYQWNALPRPLYSAGLGSVLEKVSSFRHFRDQKALHFEDDRLGDTLLAQSAFASEWTLSSAFLIECRASRTTAGYFGTGSTAHIDAGKKKRHSGAKKHTSSSSSSDVGTVNASHSTETHWNKASTTEGKLVEWCKELLNAMLDPLSQSAHYDPHPHEQVLCCIALILGRRKSSSLRRCLNALSVDMLSRVGVQMHCRDHKGVHSLASALMRHTLAGVFSHPGAKKGPGKDDGDGKASSSSSAMGDSPAAVLLQQDGMLESLLRLLDHHHHDAQDSTASPPISFISIPRGLSTPSYPADPNPNTSPKGGDLTDGVSDAVSISLGMFVAEAALIAPTRVVPALVERMHSSDGRLRWVVMDIITRIVDMEALHSTHHHQHRPITMQLCPHLLDTMHDKHVEIRKRSAQLLSACEPAYVLPRIAPLLVHKNAQVRSSAMDTLIALMKAKGDVKAKTEGYIDAMRSCSISLDGDGNDDGNDKMISTRPHGRGSDGNPNELVKAMVKNRKNRWKDRVQRDGRENKKMEKMEKMEKETSSLHHHMSIIEELLRAVPKWTTAIPRDKYMDFASVTARKLFSDPQNTSIVRFARLVGTILGEVFVSHLLPSLVLPHIDKLNKAWMKDAKRSNERATEWLFERLAPLLLLKVVPFRFYRPCEDDGDGAHVLHRLQEELHALMCDEGEADQVRRVAAEVCAYGPPQRVIEALHVQLAEALKSHHIKRCKILVYCACQTFLIHSEDVTRGRLLGSEYIPLLALMMHILRVPATSLHDQEHYHNLQRGCVDCIALMMNAGERERDHYHKAHSHAMSELHEEDTHKKGTSTRVMNEYTLSISSVLDGYSLCHLSSMVDGYMRSVESVTSLWDVVLHIGDEELSSPSPHRLSITPSDVPHHVEFTMSMVNVMISSCRYLPMRCLLRLCRQGLLHDVMERTIALDTTPSSAMSRLHLQGAYVQLIFTLGYYIKEGIAAYVVDMYGFTIEMLRRPSSIIQLAALKLMGVLLSNSDELFDVSSDSTAMSRMYNAIGTLQALCASSEAHSEVYTLSQKLLALLEADQRSN